MRVGIIQSNYIPWRGYFDFINSVDLFIIHDDLQYTKGDWRNRNKIKTSQGLTWLTVPVHYQNVSQLICDTQIDYLQKWQLSHLNQFTSNYYKAPFFTESINLLKTAFSFQELTISELNIRLIQLACEYLSINTPIVFSQDYKFKGIKTEKLIHLLKKVGATNYLSGPTAKKYLDEDLFRQNNICLEYKTYDYDTYPQLWGDFIGSVSVLDLIANLGKEAKNHITSKTPHLVNLNH